MDTINLNPATSVMASDKFLPVTVIHLYESIRNGENKLYVEIADILKDGETAAFQPLTEDTARHLGEKLYKGTSSIARGIIPRNLLSLTWNNDKPVMVWWTPKQKVKAYYTKELNIPNGTIDVPALVWRFDQDELEIAIYALKDDKEPDIKTKLYHAPFHNVYVDGNVCIGSGDTHLNTHSREFSTIMATAMHVFWGTKFSEIHNDKAIIKGNLNVLHHDLVKGKKFPLDLLSPTKKTLKTLYNES